MSEQRRDGVALLLTAPIATISLLVSTTISGLFGSLIWGIGKIWQAGFPYFWKKNIEGEKISFPIPSRRAINDGISLGVIMSIVIVAAWLLFGGLLDKHQIRGFVEPFGLLNPWLFLAAFLYWVTLNSLLEEYLFRWFVFEKAEGLFNSRIALFISALSFTSHHFFGTLAMFPLFAVILATLGVFSGGFVWSLLYVKHRSIWPCYVSHVIVDVTMFGIGGYILFF